WNQWKIRKAHARSRALNPRASGFEQALGLYAGYVLLHYLYELGLVRWGSYPWHFVSYIPMAALGAPWLIERALSRTPSATATGWACRAIALLLLLTLPIGYYAWAQKEWRMLY